jgi:hypothetical protein
MSRGNALKWIRGQNIRGTDNELIPENQIFLLGGNPLPIRVACDVLQPKRVALILTPDLIVQSTEELEKQLKSSAGIKSIERFITSHWDHKDILDAMEKAFLSFNQNEPVGLHFTGGTKIMSSEARVWFEYKHKGYYDHRCTYLHPRKGMIFLGIQAPMPISDVIVPLSDLYNIHGLKEIESNRENEILKNKIADAIGKFFFHNMASPAELWQSFNDKYLPTLPPLYDNKATIPGTTNEKGEANPGFTVSSIHRNLERPLMISFSAADSKNFKASSAFGDWKLMDLVKLVPDSGIKPNSSLKDVFAKGKSFDTAKFLTTKWFENWMRQKLESLAWPCFNEVASGIHLTSIGSGVDDFEADVIACYRYLPILVSCTLEQDNPRCKGKAIEALARSTQFGGDHCRHVAATWIPDDAKLVKLWRELAVHWQAPDRFRVFGLTHYLGGKATTHCRSNGEPVMESFEEMFNNWFDNDVQAAAEGD